MSLSPLRPVQAEPPPPVRSLMSVAGLMAQKEGTSRWCEFRVGPRGDTPCGLSRTAEDVGTELRLAHGPVYPGSGL
jgi:hypothetical protein